jgi:plasmid stability protein
MSVMIQIRNVPDELHRRLKARAALEGRSLSDYALAELTKSLERPTRAELFERLAERPILELTETPAAIIRSDRDDARR